MTRKQAHPQPKTLREQLQASVEASLTPEQRLQLRELVRLSIEETLYPPNPPTRHAKWYLKRGWDQGYLEMQRKWTLETRYSELKRIREFAKHNSLELPKEFNYEMLALFCDVELARRATEAKGL